MGKFFPDSPTTYGEEKLVNLYAACLPRLVCLSATHSLWYAIAVFGFAQVRARPSGAPVCSPPPPPSCARVIGGCVVGDGLAETGAALPPGVN